MNEKSILTKAIQTYGRESQMRMLQEECAELIQAINKYFRNRDDESREDNLAEEIADVEILINQTRMMLGLDYKIKRARLYKLYRLEKRCNERSKSNVNVDTD